MKESIKKILEFSVFVILASLPFIMATNTLGVDAFLDSFENPDSYISFKNTDTASGVTTNSEKYMIIQKMNHPDFEIQKEDAVLYFNVDGGLECNKIHEINGVGIFTRYYIEKENEGEELIFNNQIVGRVIKVLDENILTDISLKIWDISINNLNIEAII